MLRGVALPPATAQITDFTTNPPDPVMGELVTYTAVTQGNNQTVASFNWEYRYIEAATRPCGPWISAMAQERMTEIQFANPPFAGNYPTSDWSPVEHPVTEFRIEGNQIFDVHHQEGFEALWPLLQLFVMRSKQHLRLKFTDPCGQVQYVYLGTVTHVRLKANDNEWTAHGTVNEP